MYNALLKYGYDDFDKIIIEICDLNESILNKKETFWITKYDSVENGYNLTYGGDHRTLSIESRNKISAPKKGKLFGPMKEETRRKISKSLQCRIRPSEVGERISKSLTGKKHSIDSKKKMSQHIFTQDHKTKLSLSHINVPLSPSHSQSIKNALYKRKMLGLPIGRPKTPTKS